MRKRISKQKEWKPTEQKSSAKQCRPQPNACPLQTIQILLNKTECLQNTLKFEKERIDRIVVGTSIESIRFLQVQKNICFEQFLKKYHRFEDIKCVFTGLIRKNSLVGGITFMDFKLKNFIIMNNYAHQLRRINTAKDKSDTNITASHSSTKEGKHFKELEMEVKRITKRNANSKKHHRNGSASFVNLLSKNIQRMRKNNRDNHLKPQQQMDFKPILTAKAFLTCQDFNTQFQRLHTTPDPQQFDAYGLQQFRGKNSRKLQQISQLSRINRDLPRSKLNTEKSQDTLRYQTEYDTEKIQTKRSKSKKNVISFKKSSSKTKTTSKGKSPSMISALQKHKK